MLLRLVLLGLAVLSLSRVALIIWQWERVKAAGIVDRMLVQGGCADLILLGYPIVVPVLLAPLLAHRFTSRAWKIFSSAWATVALIFVVFMELSSPQFIMQFDVRPNRLFIEYLSYPKAVLATLWNEFRIALVGGMVFTVVLELASYRLLKSVSDQASTWSSKKSSLTWPPDPAAGAGADSVPRSPSRQSGAVRAER